MTEKNDRFYFLIWAFSFLHFIDWIYNVRTKYQHFFSLRVFFSSTLRIKQQKYKQKHRINTIDRVTEWHSIYQIEMNQNETNKKGWSRLYFLIESKALMFLKTGFRDCVRKTKTTTIIHFMCIFKSANSKISRLIHILL